MHRFLMPPFVVAQIVMVGFAVGQFADSIIRQNCTMIGFWFAIALANMVFTVPAMMLLCDRNKGDK